MKKRIKQLIEQAKHAPASPRRPFLVVTNQQRPTTPARLIDAGKSYTVPELAVLSDWSENTIRTMFRHHPLVQKLAGPTRRRVAIRIPGTVALQVMADLQREPTVVKVQKVKKVKKYVYLRPEKHKKAVARAEALATAESTKAA